MAMAEILGQRVRVYRNGIVWVHPDTGQRLLLGKTRAEAIEALRSMLPIKHSRRPTPPDILASADESAAKLYRAYWRAYYYAHSRARKASIHMLGKGEFESIIERADGKCEVTGFAFSLDRASARKALWAPSLDRIHSRGDYSLGNCRLVCVAVNLALNEFGLDVLKKIAASLK